MRKSSHFFQGAISCYFRTVIVKDPVPCMFVFKDKAVIRHTQLHHLNAFKQWNKNVHMQLPVDSTCVSPNDELALISWIRHCPPTDKLTNTKRLVNEMVENCKMEMDFVFLRYTFSRDGVSAGAL